MRTAALVITAFVGTFVGLTVAAGVSQAHAAVPQGDTGHHAVTTYHGLPLCGEVDDDCYLPASRSDLPGHVPAVILNGVVFTVDEFLN